MSKHAEPKHAEPIDCPNHHPRQHRDGKPPWCPRCGLDAAGRIPNSIFRKEPASDRTR